MSDTTYNGWKNYATWRVSLELWNDYEWQYESGKFNDVHDLAEWIKDESDNVVSEHGFHTDDVAVAYARAFMANVDWLEIAEHVAADFPEVIRG